MDDIYIRVGEQWESHSGGNGGGISWTSLDRRGQIGVLRFADEAPPDASAALIEYEGDTYRVPVRHGHFPFVAWNTPYSEDAQLSRFE